LQTETFAGKNKKKI